MSDDEKDAGVSEEGTPVELIEVQVWNELSGQTDEPITTSDSDELKTEAAADDQAEEHAEETASSEGDDDGEGQKETEQPVKAEQEIKRLRGQVGGKDRQIRELQQRIAEQAKERQAQDAEKKDPADLDELEELYPDLVKPLRQETSDIRNRLDALSKGLDTVAELQETTQQVEVSHEREIFFDKRPEGLDVVKKDSAAFWNWVNDQPFADREMALANQNAVVDGEGLSDLLSRYDRHLGVETAQPSPDPVEDPKPKTTSRASNARLAGAATVPGGGQRVTSKPQPNDTDEVAIWNSMN